MGNWTGDKDSSAVKAMMESLQKGLGCKRNLYGEREIWTGKNNFPTLSTPNGLEFSSSTPASESCDDLPHRKGNGIYGTLRQVLKLQVGQSITLEFQIC